MVVPMLQIRNMKDEVNSTWPRVCALAAPGPWGCRGEALPRGELCGDWQAVAQAGAARVGQGSLSLASQASESSGDGRGAREGQVQDGAAGQSTLPMGQQLRTPGVRVEGRALARVPQPG